MDKKYLRVKKDGFIFEYDEELAKHDLCEVVTEQEAYPERSKRKRSSSKLDDPLPDQPSSSDDASVASLSSPDEF